MEPLFTLNDFFVLKPVILLCLFGCGILLTDFLLKQGRWNAVTALLAQFFFIFPPIPFPFIGEISGALWQHARVAREQGQLFALNNSMVVDSFSVFFNGIFVVSAILAIIIASRYMDDEHSNRGEFYGLMLFAQAGMSVMAQGYDLVTLFIGLELMALSFYVMVGFLRDELRANEAAMKYLILGALSSGFLAYGFSIFYGMSGSTNLGVIADAVAGRDLTDPVLLLAMVTTSVGLFFKISVVPFHMWAPDVYEGAPTPITAYVSVASKAASFAMMMRIFLVPLGTAQDLWMPLFGAVALVTMTLGNLAALTQNNLKRLLAYSSISHAGYILLGLAAGNETGLKGISLYILVYIFMNFGVFALIAAMRREGHAAEDIDDLAGLIHRHPGYAILMLVLLLSLAGIPPMAGFYGKYFIFLGLLEAGQYMLAIFAALYVAVSAYYYFRIVRAMFLSESAVEPAAISPGLGTKAALIASAVLTLVIGLYPEPFINMATDSILLALR